MVRKSTKKVEAQESLKVEETKVEAKFQFFKITDADGFAVIQIMDQRGVFPTKDIKVPDGIIGYASGKGKFVFAGSKREAAARLTSEGFIEV